MDKKTTDKVDNIQNNKNKVIFDMDKYKKLVDG